MVKSLNGFPVQVKVMSMFTSHYSDTIQSRTRHVKKNSGNKNFEFTQNVWYRNIKEQGTEESITRRIVCVRI